MGPLDVAADDDAGRRVTEHLAVGKDLGEMEQSLPALHHDLDDLAGTWVHDEATEQALDQMRQVDESMWQ